MIHVLHAMLCADEGTFTAVPQHDQHMHGDATLLHHSLRQHWVQEVPAHVQDTLSAAVLTS